MCGVKGSTAGLRSPVTELSRRQDRRDDQSSPGQKANHAYGDTLPGSILGNPLPSSILLILGSSI